MSVLYNFLEVLKPILIKTNKSKLPVMKTSIIKSTMALVSFIPLTINASALPDNGVIQSGSGSISSDGTTMNIHQASDRMAIDWNRFSVGAGNTVNFLQPSSSSVSLNRVTGGDPSSILGSINANGRVFLTNPAGVLFGTSAQVNVGGLVATTLDIDGSDFNSGNYVFSGGSGNAVVNHGNIVASNSGGVALIAARVENTGSINAQAGNVGLAAGSRVRVDFGGPVFVELEEGTLNAFVDQGGAVRADGGTVYMTAKTAGDIASTVINHTGVTEARTLAAGENGRIFLLGDMDRGRIEVAGKLDASAPHGGDGGFIETSAADVHLDRNLLVTTDAPLGTTGEWLIDPTDIFIEADSFTGTNGLSANTIATNLATTNVSIATVSTGTEAGNITINAPITWSSNNDLTFIAHGSIFINSDITASGASARLTLRYGQSSTNGGTHNYFLHNSKINLSSGNPANTTVTTLAQNFATKKGTSGSDILYRVIENESQLRALGTANSDAAWKEQRYALGADITMGSTGFNPIGNSGSKFESSLFHGLGHSITDLVVNRAGLDYNGLFGFAIKSDIRDVSLKNASITGRDYTAGLVGYHEEGTLFRIYFDHGTVTGTNYVGGLAGYLKGGSSGVDVISESFSTGTITGSGQYIGGVLGYLEQGTIRNSYSRATVTGAGTHRGGLIGYAKGTYNVFNSYAAGSVTGSGGTIGGLIGTTEGTRTVTNSFWDATATGQTRSANNVTGTDTGSFEVTRTTAQMKTQSTFTDPAGLPVPGSPWDFNNIWAIDGTNTINDGYPYFGWAFAPPPLLALSIMFDNVSFTYNGSAYVFDLANLTFSIPSASDDGTVNFIVNGDESNQAVNAGLYNITLSTTGFTGYSVTLVPGTLTINPAELTLTSIDSALAAFIANNKVYDGTVAANISDFSNLGLTGVIGADVVNISSVLGAFADPNVANGIGVSLTGVTLGGAAGGNYTVNLVGAPTTVADITPKTLTLSGGFTASNKVYDGNTTASVTANTLSLLGLIGGEDVTVSFATHEAEFDNKNVGTNKTVSLILDNLQLNNGSTAGLASNYLLSLVDAPTALANITAATLTLQVINDTLAAFIANNKVYDSTDAANISDFSNLGLSGIFGSDAVSISAVLGAFDDPNVANGIEVGLTGVTLSGTDAGNYNISLTGAPTALANITPKTLTLSGGFSASNKIYDGNTTATVTGNTLSLLGLISGEDVTVSFATHEAQFDNKNVGTNKTVSLILDNLQLNNGSTAGLASNYLLSLADAPTALANITAATLTLQIINDALAAFIADNKFFDGTVAANISDFSNLGLSGILGSDTVNISALLGAFADPNVANDIEVSLTGFTLSGADADNYIIDLTGAPTSLADILPIPAGPLLPNPLVDMVEQLYQQPDKTPNSEPLLTLNYQDVDSEGDLIEEDEKKSKLDLGNVVILVVDTGIAVPRSNPAAGNINSDQE